MHNDLIMNKHIQLNRIFICTCILFATLYNNYITTIISQVHKIVCCFILFVFYFLLLLIFLDRLLDLDESFFSD